jgi:hypothetical protein
MSPFACRIVDVKIPASGDGQITLEFEGQRLTLPIRPLSLYLPWIKSWKAGDEISCHVSQNHSCGLRNGTSHIDPLVLDGPAYRVLKEWASGTPLLHGEDIVQEIATGRQGKIDAIGSEITHGRETQTNWRVAFADGKAPPLLTFTNRSQLRFVRCPHGDPEPGFYPAEGIL